MRCISRAYIPLVVFVMAVLISLSGCAAISPRLVMVTCGLLADRSDIPSATLSCLESDQVSIPSNDISAKNKSGRCRVRYHHSYSSNRWMVVKGRLNNGREYPVILDTGASAALFLNDLHIIENKIPIYPFARLTNGPGCGMCQMPQVHIGTIALPSGNCYYQEQHPEIKMLGLTISKSKALIAGLPSLKQLKYIAFDSIRKEAEISLNNSFTPQHPEKWASYPMQIKKDYGGNEFAAVQIPLADQNITLQLDTGSGNGLALSRRLWNKIRHDIQDVHLKNSTELYPYIGTLTCQKGTIPNLVCGQRTIQNINVAVFPDDSELVQSCEGLIGMQLFENTVLVVDFEKQLIWVKN